jgi:hypothetical protein
MNKIFISCGQFTDEEKALGKAIVKMVKEVTGSEAFFAEEVSDLNGLDSNILEALRDASGFITVLHPRGEITRPDGSTLIRASVWIEQEIAVATYIQRVEKRSLPVIAFVHKSVGREGIRELVHLNPILFTHESEVLDALRERLQSWKSLTSGGIRVQLESGRRSNEQGHWIRQLGVNLVNDSNVRITSFNCQVRVPAGILKHWSCIYPSEGASDNPSYRCFSFDEGGRGPIPPHKALRIFSIEYCTRCAAEHTGEIAAIAGAIVGESVVEAKVWIDGREYDAERTIKELSADEETRQ